MCLVSFTLRSHYHFGKCFHISTGRLLACRTHLITTTVMRSSLFWAVTQSQLVVGYRRFGTTYQFHLQCPSSPRRALGFDVSVQPISFIFNAQAVQEEPWVIWSLKTGPTGRPETSVTNYQTTLRNIPEDRISYLHRRGSLKSRSSGGEMLNLTRVPTGSSHILSVLFQTNWFSK